MASGSNNSLEDSNRRATLRPAVVLGLKAAGMALDGLPVPGAKGCVNAIVHCIEAADLVSENAEALQSLQKRLESLQEVLSPIHASKTVPDDILKSVENLVAKLNELAAQWSALVAQKNRKRYLLQRLLKADDDRKLLTRFASRIGEAIQDFLAITVTTGRIAAFREEIKNRESRTLHSLPRARSASYNSARTGGATTCLEGTRVSILETIRKWATNPEPDRPPMFWLNGLAGIGKTTIAHTIAAELDEMGLLGASFVFLRADDQLKDARLVLPTLAFQLARFSPEFRAALVDVLEEDPDCGSKLLQIQFDTLIVRPWRAMQLSQPIVLILDALDECESVILTGELLSIFLRSIRNLPFVRVFITSRPEGHIRDALDLREAKSESHETLVLHEDVYSEEVESDIRRFLKLRLQQIWDERMKNYPGQWPSDGELEVLAKQSGKLFIYAATAVRFIGGNPALNLSRQLRTLLTMKSGQVPHGEPYRRLDGLYLQILENIFADSDDPFYVQRFRHIVGSIVLLERPLPLTSIAEILGDYTAEDIRETLYHLHSIFVVPVANTREVPRAYHLSFPDFVTNSERCTNPTAYISPSSQAKQLFLRCLGVMEQGFGWVLAEESSAGDNRINNPIPPVSTMKSQPDDFDELSSESTHIHTSFEDGDDNHVDRHDLPTHLWYSDTFWYRHLIQTPPADEDVARSFRRFLGQSQSGWPWLDRRISKIENNSLDKPRLLRETVDIIYEVYHWGVRSQLSVDLLAALEHRTRHAFRRIDPGSIYKFGRRLSTGSAIILTWSLPGPW